jgi:hypothetical protein
MHRQYGLGRIHMPDPKDRLYPATLVLARMRTERRGTRWRSPRRLDQGMTGTCVGHGWRGWYEAEPTMHKAEEGPDAFALYRRAVLLDDFADNDGDATNPVNSQLQCGSSVRAGAQAMQELGLIGSYVWATRAQDIADFVTRADGSTVVVGTTWYNAMFNPAKDGTIRLDGGEAGGHCWLIDWWDGQHFWGATSWGDDFGLKDEFGIGGYFKVSMGQMDRLLRQGGEACCGVEQVIQPLSV